MIQVMWELVMSSEMIMMIPVLRQRRGRSFARQGDAARDRQDWPHAAAAYRNAVRLIPKRTDLWVQYGHALKGMGNLVDAELAYRRALSAQPFNADTHLQLGHVLKMLNRHEEAAFAYKRAYILAPAWQPPLAELNNYHIDYRNQVTLPTN
ncbi:hypothetical protein D3W54_06815 [Komagataeibacter medellinensis]|uniref:Tetratricopeptide repeat protein n=2 Tax=Komagataeibacter medellinensis TaxID=1177712 RepID=A0ABQ6VUS6_9PROT|nr:hypothetical protein D3W54_06815 [Komagataeibacter medellinensis]